MPTSKVWIALWIALLVGLGGCCAGGGNFLTIGHAGSPPRWGTTVERPQNDTSFVVTVRPSERIDGDPIEIYQGAQRKDVPKTDAVVDNSKNNGCGHSRKLVYDVGALPPGTYTVVHRRGSAGAGKINCEPDCPYTRFRGVGALVLALTLTPATPPRRRE